MSKPKWHLKKENTPQSKMYCGRKANIYGGTAHFTTTMISVFMIRPCIRCLNKLREEKESLKSGE